MARPDAPRAFAAAPILIRDEVFGVLGGSYFEPHAFTEREISLLSSLAAQGAVAIENARLYSVTQQNLAGAALLNAAARTLHRTLDVRRLLPDAAGHARARPSGPGARASCCSRSAGAGPGDVIAWGDWSHESVRALAEPLRRREAPLLIADSAARRDLLGRRAPRAGRGAGRLPGARPQPGAGRPAPALPGAAHAHRGRDAPGRGLRRPARDGARQRRRSSRRRRTRRRGSSRSSPRPPTASWCSTSTAAWWRSTGRAATLLGINPHEVIGRPLARLVETLAGSGGLGGARAGAPSSTALEQRGRRGGRRSRAAAPGAPHPPLADHPDARPARGGGGHHRHAARRDARARDRPHEDRVRLHRLARAAHAAHLDQGVAAPAAVRRRPACSTRPSASSWTSR